MAILPSESTIKAGEMLFSSNCGYTDKRHKVNLANRTVSEDILREIENGCAIETLERIAVDFPICKYQTQITIHGKFPELKTDRIGCYKNLVRNKNMSVGVRWSAIDHDKRARLFHIAHIVSGWNVIESSTAFFLRKIVVVHDKEEYAAALEGLQAEASRINAVGGLFQGGCDILKVASWGRVYLVLNVYINSFYDKDFDTIAAAVCNAAIDTINAKIAEHEEKKRKENEQYQKELEETRRKWELEQQEERLRRAAFMANLKLPFNAVWGEHKGKQGDIYAVVAHEQKFDRRSPFVVRYYTVKKSFGRLCAYPCDENGTITKQHGRELLNGKYKGYRKTA